MALGKRQQEMLSWYTELLKRHPDGSVKVTVSAGARQYLSRENGGGYGRPIHVTAWEIYGGEINMMRRNWIATCRHDHTVRDKMHEIAASLVEQTGERVYANQAKGLLEVVVTGGEM